ncbi:bifunctional adenosylcobinamide kinase/adenosylcobinamide-phosphate guanylyltransferase [Nocardioides sp. GXZ039]|uniref:bifunctional adenosylcobinamide kinase/adenosylcobinamide-phosphate guanylyltransferase n=1 Tax=Nocardioides sp. GXZ039 TaxID=3136018 RepID=UPI0030F3C02C
MRILVTGGVRSGKSRHAESLVPGPATYVAPGPTLAEDADPDWAARVKAHQDRRPPTWTTVEARDLAAALGIRGPVIVDCLGTWLSAVLDERALWDSPSAEAETVVRGLVEEAADVIRGRDDVVLVTNEVGLGVVPAHRSGRLFRDLLGRVNQEIAAACDEVHLVVAGRVLRL